jgi:hypothetical protein
MRRRLSFVRFKNGVGNAPFSVLGSCGFDVAKLGTDPGKAGRLSAVVHNTTRMPGYMYGVFARCYRLFSDGFSTEGLAKSYLLVPIFYPLSTGPITTRTK